ncbi:MAG: hypothetical protein GY711_30125 [bacterium]|nr:hypothetical protein [bacterium]
MTLPRWTAYPALAVLVVMLVTAIPKPTVRRVGTVPRGTAVLPPASHPRVVVLGIDGMDPDILQELLDADPTAMPNFRRLIAEGSGIRVLGTSTPPQSPVAWSNFITGRNPGGHGIYDFLHRNPKTYKVLPGIATAAEVNVIDLPGKWQFPITEGGDPNRSGAAFWTLLRDAGVPADVWRMPINFPVEAAEGLSFSGMMTPAVDSAYGEPSLYSTDPAPERIGDDKVKQVSVRGGIVRTSLLGPKNEFLDSGQREEIPLTVYVDEESGGAAVEIADQVIVLEPGEWSDFVTVKFDLLPVGLMGMSGVVRFHLKSIAPEFEMYASPVNIDPRDPISPVSEPESASADLADGIGTYYTQGMPEDVNALKKRLLDDEEFMHQSDLVYRERGRMLDYALERYVANEDGGLLFFYYSTVDLCGHMMWRHSDPQHPHHEPEFAAADSSWWSGREGSTWKDVIQDLYRKMDPILGEIRERVGDDTTIIVMSDHGFAPYRRKFSLNTWLLESGYLVLKAEQTRELPHGDPDRVDVAIHDAVDWSRTRAYGMGFNGLYLNRAGREAQGIVTESEAPALIAEIAAKLEAFRDSERDGAQVVLSADIGSTVYKGERLDESPDIVVGYNVSYGNSDEASLGRITNKVLTDNTGGTFNGSHLMAPQVVNGILITNAEVAIDDPRLEDMTVEILKQYDVETDAAMDGRPVFR